MDDLKQEILDFIYQYGQIDGVHHKAWVIDQIVRKLTNDSYHDWVEEYEEIDEYGEKQYEWEIGIAP